MLVCLSVGQDSERRCNGRTDQEFIWDVDTWGFRNHVLVGPRFPPPLGGGHFGRTYMDMPRVPGDQYSQPYSQ